MNPHKQPQTVVINIYRTSQFVRFDSDVQIVNEVMLEDINNILNAGDVPNLYAPEDLDAIMSACRYVGDK